MSINRAISRVLAGSNAKVICGQCVGQINPYVEWTKWLSYESEYEKQICVSVDGKTSLDVSDDEYQKVCEIKRNRLFAELFKKYGTSECTKREYMMVHDYMSNESIENLMMSKLSSQELGYAKEQIMYFSQLSNEELSKKVHEEQKEDAYNQLSMADSYVLHMISQINFTRSLRKLNKEIATQIEANEVMSHRSLYYASNQYQKK